MQLFKLVLAVPHSRAAFAESLLDAYKIPFQEELDAVSVTADGLPGRTYIVYADPTQREPWQSLLAARGLAPYLTVEPFDYDPDAWVHKWKDYYEWVAISPRLAVGPVFKEPPFQRPVTVRIDPGQAFGTGVHESTRIALGFLDAHLPPGGTVLDAGCGTGILAIAARKLGATRCLGFDIDREAARESLANAALNEVEIDVYRGGIEAVNGSFDLVVANMLSFRLQAISSPLREAVKPGGHLILAGLIQADSPAFEKAFFAGDSRFRELDRNRLNDWWGAIYRRNP